MSRGFLITRAASTVSTGQKTALITGGNSGIGFETAKSLSSQGYNIILGC
jgi:NAD(P)-dependent dehydrogenase (short-subunit alcohol dehydrogenase family)